MKFGKLILLAVFAQSIFCQAQAPAPVDQLAPAAAPALAVPSTAAPALAAGAAAESYIIGPSDVLTVTVWKEPTLSGNLLVRPDGMVSEPLLGDVMAAGLTPLQLSQQIGTKLKKFIQDPTVTIVITAIHSKLIYMLGEVGRKGPLEMTPGMTLLEAIASAGGVTDFANTKKIYILRDEAGKHQKIPVQYKKALKGDSTLNIALKSGDTIVVP